MKARQHEESFEQALKKLEHIVQQLEAGELSLDESLNLFEEGIHLTRICSSRLDEAERRISLLTKDENGKCTLRSVDPKEFIKKGSDEEDGTA